MKKFNELIQFIKSNNTSVRSFCIDNNLSYSVIYPRINKQIRILYWNNNNSKNLLNGQRGLKIFDKNKYAIAISVYQKNHLITDKYFLDKKCLIKKIESLSIEDFYIEIFNKLNI